MTKSINLRSHLLAPLALALMMLSACSSTDETSDTGGGSGGSSCEDACYSDDVPDFQLDECLMVCGAD